MNETPESFYIRQLSKYQEKLKKVKNQLRLSSGIRLIWFLGVLTICYFLYPLVQSIISTILIGAVVFLFLITRHNRLTYQKRKYLKIIDINKTELEILKGNFQHLDTGEEFINPKHEFSYDVDLFGKNSFFQYINRTTTKESKGLLASILIGNLTDRINEKQEAIKELAGEKNWRQNFSAIAALLATKTDINTVIKWVSGYQPLLPKWMTRFTKIFSILSIVLITGYFFEIINGFVLTAWFFIGLGINGFYIKKVNKLYAYAGRSKEVFNQYYQIVEIIEGSDFKSKILLDHHNLLVQKQAKSSQTLKKFSKILDAFDQRNNMIYGIFGNAFLLWDLTQVTKMDAWIVKYASQVKVWFDVVTFFDTYNTLGNFAFNHPNFIFPEIQKNSIIIDAVQLGHPMLSPQKRVDNDILIKKEEFFITTGANMAGKSTFLRTVALQIIMANTGLPVCAKSCKYSPVKLMTSMRTSDSLSEESSYFFSELTQLKRIVDVLEKDHYFVILDEILKGTNSKDKAEGSKKFVEKLVRSKATGIIATHDLSLCKIAKEIDVVKNKYFDAQILNDELYFDYKFKDGICQNMNASFLLNKMGVV